MAPEWVRGDRFDALMNYPLLEAILGFVGGPSLDVALVASHHQLSMHVRLTGAAAFAAALKAQVAAYEPATVASELSCPRPTTCLGSARSCSATLPRSAWPSSSRSPCLRRPASTMATRSAWTVATTRTAGEPFHRPAGRDQALRATFRDLIAGRKEHPALPADGLRVIAAADACVAIVRVRRRSPAGGETLLVVANAGSAPVSTTFELPGTRWAAVLLPVSGLAAGFRSRVAADERLAGAVPARSGAVPGAAG